MKTISSHFAEKPHTRLGWWSVWLGTVFVVMFIINITALSPVMDDPQWRQMILPLYWSFMLLCGLAGGIIGLLAVIRLQERSSLTWLSILVGLFIFILVMNESLQALRFFTGN